MKHLYKIKPELVEQCKNYAENFDMPVDHLIFLMIAYKAPDFVFGKQHYISYGTIAKYEVNSPSYPPVSIDIPDLAYMALEVVSQNSLCLQDTVLQYCLQSSLSYFNDFEAWYAENASVYKII